MFLVLMIPPTRVMIPTNTFKYFNHKYGVDLHVFLLCTLLSVSVFHTAGCFLTKTPVSNPVVNENTFSSVISSCLLISEIAFHPYADLGLMLIQKRTQ